MEWNIIYLYHIKTFQQRRTHEVKRTLLKREVVQYYEQKDENGNRQICKETEAITMNDENNPTIVTTVEYY